MLRRPRADNMPINFGPAAITLGCLTEVSLAKTGSRRRTQGPHMLAQRPVPSSEGRRIVICDYNALLLSVTGLLRMSGYCVFQAHDGLAAQELCVQLDDISLLVLNTYRDRNRFRRLGPARPRRQAGYPSPSYRLLRPRRLARRCADSGRGLHPRPAPHDRECARREAVWREGPGIILEGCPLTRASHSEISGSGWGRSPSRQRKPLCAGQIRGWLTAGDW